MNINEFVGLWDTGGNLHLKWCPYTVLHNLGWTLLESRLGIAQTGHLGPGCQAVQTSLQLTLPLSFIATYNNSTKTSRSASSTLYCNCGINKNQYHTPNMNAKICVTPNANPQHNQVEYRWHWVPNARGWRSACRFHVVYFLFPRVGYPMQTQFPLEYGLTCIAYISRSRVIEI